MSLVLTFIVEVVDGITVGEDDAVIAPLVAQDIDKQAVTAAAWFPLETLVCTHHLADVAFLHQCLEGWQVGLSST